MLKPPRRRRFGQHFLESSWARKVVEAVAPEPGDAFLEIGPGTGAITRPLAAAGASIIAVEVDRDLATQLAADAIQNVTIVTGDFLQIDVLPIVFGTRPQAVARDASESRAGGRMRVVGNLPYNVSTPILFRLLDLQQETGMFVDATLMVQREVADRLTARPGTRDYGVLSIFVQLDAEVTRLLALPPGAFRPPPKVRSALVRLRFRPREVSIPDADLFTSMVRQVFTRRRKTILNAVKPFARSLGASAEAGLAIAGVRPGRRPETLQLSELARLAAVLAAARRRPVL